MKPCSGGCFIDRLTAWLSAWGYREIEIPSLVSASMFRSCIEGSENRMLALDEKLALIPEVTNYIRALGMQRMGARKIFYVARCFRDESACDAERLRELTQVGVELLGDNVLDCRKDVRRDALRLFTRLVPTDRWTLEDGVKRGLQLYSDAGKTFEITSRKTRKQLLGGGPYQGGAGWALGVERLMLALETA